MVWRSLNQSINDALIVVDKLDSFFFFAEIIQKLRFLSEFIKAHPRANIYRN